MISARILDDVVDVNNFVFSTEQTQFNGDAFSMYIQLYDTSKLPQKNGFHPGGLRYVPQAGATMMVYFGNIDDAKKVSRVATQPFAQDPSIWKVAVLATDPISGTVNITAKLTEGTAVTTVFLKAALLVGNGDVC